MTLSILKLYPEKSKITKFVKISFYVIESILIKHIAFNYKLFSYIT